MLKSGLFVTPNETYTVYEVEESGFYRIDFVHQGAQFQVEFDKVVYSQVKRRNIFTIGDSRVYDEYLKVKSTIASAKMTTTKDTYWEDGVYVTKYHSENTKLGYTMDSEYRNGKLENYVSIGKGYAIQSFVVDPIYGAKLDPINFVEYQNIQVSKDTVDNGTGIFYTLDVLKRRFSLSHIDQYDFVVADNLELARKRLREFKNNPYPFKGFDTETTGLDICLYGEDHMVGIILGADKYTSTYFPFRMEAMDNLPISFLQEIFDVIKPIEDKLVAHNKKFDREVMLDEGYDLLIGWDTMQVSLILNPVLGKNIHGEKYLTYELRGCYFLELSDIFINPKDINFAVLTKDIVKYYACPDGTNPLWLLEDMLKKLPKYQYKLATLECRLADVKADQEYYGVRVDTVKFEKQYRNCNYIIDVLLKAFRTLTHEDGNINSAAVLSNLLYNKMHCKVLLRTDMGQPSTSMAAISKLAKVRAKNPVNITEDLVDLFGNVIIKAEDLSKSAYPALVILDKYKKYNKLKTAFYARFERTMKTGRIFFWINQNGAATGRQSSPMHQLPPELKDVILSDAENRDFWGPDYSQVELRMIAYLAGEKELIELASDPDKDIHRIIGSLITGKPMWAITPEERTIGKRRNFGVVYLISKFGLAGQLKGPGYTVEDVRFADQQLKDFFKRFKRINRYIKLNGQKVQKYGYMMTAWFNRKRVFKEILDPNIDPATKASIIRMSNNVPVQGTAADLMKQGECNIDAYIRMKGWNKIQEDGFPLVRLMLSIHDECIISAHNSIPYEEIVEMIKTCMEITVKDAPPFFVQPARMDCWGGHSDDAVAMPIPYRDKIIDDYHKTGKSVFHQSWFKLVIPDDIKATILDESLSMSERIQQCYSKVTLDYVKGDHVKEANSDHVKNALHKYIESGMSMYRIDDYLDNLNHYRETQLRTYMYDLISKYGTDYKVVGEKVRHPSLTFQLLDLYDKEISRDMDHVDRITEAARLYIEREVLSKEKVRKTFIYEMSEETKAPTEIEEFAENVEALVQFDAKGNVIYYDENESEENVYNQYYEEEYGDLLELVDGAPEYVYELADAIVFDTNSLKKDDVNKVLSYIYQFKRSDGFYKTYVIYNDKMIDTGIPVEEMDIEAANKIVCNLVEKGLVNIV